MAKITDLASIQKAAKTIHEHLEKHMEMHKALHEKLEGHLAKEHPILKAHQAMMDHCEKCMKAAKEAMDGEEPEPEKKEAVASADAISKAVADALAPVVAQVTELKDKISKLPAAAAMPTTGASADQRVSKADAAFGELIAAR